HIRRGSSLGLILRLALVLRVIHASSNAVSKTTRVSGSNDPLPIPSMFPLHDSRLLGNNVFEPPPENSRIFGITWKFAHLSKPRGEASVSWNLSCTVRPR